ncbi:MAG TPA: hypothetical protein PKA83_19885 [Pirellulaceae bacterium]|nr:hypothetical protein [Pirellulaceae bacterium]
MSRRRSATISCREARDLYLLVGACRALGLDGGAWRRHLVVHLRRLMDADVAFLADYSVSAPPGTCSDWCSPISLIDDGWKTQADRQAFWEVASGCGTPRDWQHASAEHAHPDRST